MRAHWLAKEASLCDLIGSAAARRGGKSRSFVAVLTIGKVGQQHTALARNSRRWIFVTAVNCVCWTVEGRRKKRFW